MSLYKQATTITDIRTSDPCVVPEFAGTNRFAAKRDCNAPGSELHSGRV
jgi:hypothetical protein